jgi:VanZ family protein
MDRSIQARIRPLLAASWAIAWVGVAALLLLPVPVASPGRSDLLVHFGLFAGMAFAAIAFSRRAGQLAGLALLTIIGGTALEFAQKLVAYRSFDLTDAAANALGATSGFALAVIVLALWLRPGGPGRATDEPADVRASTVFSIRPSGAPAKLWTWKCITSWVPSAPVLASRR